MRAFIFNSAERLSVEAVAWVSAASRIPSSGPIASAWELAFPGLLSSRTTVHSRVLYGSSCRQSSDVRFCSYASPRFDSRLYSGTGSGHIRRPAALGLMLRFAPSRVSVPPKTNSLQNRHRTPSEFLPVPSEKADLRHLGAGPTPAASPCVPRVNSGIQNGEQKCI